MVHESGFADHFPTPLSGPPPGAPASCLGGHRPSSVFRWSVGDAGDPAELVAGYLTGNGLPVRDLRQTAIVFHPVGAGTVCGAALFVSAAAGSVMAGGPIGRTGPVPAIPDVVAVVYTHAEPAAGRMPVARTAGWRLGGRAPSWTPDEHAAAVAAVREAIGRGDVYQVNVVGHASAVYRGDPGPALARVAALPGARYGGVLAAPGWAIACASPETLVEVRAGRVITRPIKGTRPATEAGRRDLLGSAKERAEHVMIVDLERNDLARVPGVGAVRVDELFAVRRWCALWQAESVVSAPLTGPVGLADLLRAVC